MLSAYFKKSVKSSSEPTAKQLERDIHSLLHGTKEGKIVIENERPVVLGGERKIVDEVFSGRASVKETLSVEEAK